MSAPRVDSRRPDPSEYAAYYATYIDIVPEGNIAEILRAQVIDTVALLTSVGEARADERYAPDKWSIKEVVGHVADVERVFAFRALSFARGDEAEIPGMEQDDYVRVANFGARTLADLTEEFRLQREANVILAASLDDAARARTGVASGCRFSVRSILYILAGHERHHVRVLRERYLSD